jgi:hypothetical protein
MSESESPKQFISPRMKTFAGFYLAVTYGLAASPLTFVLAIHLMLPTSALFPWLFSDQEWIMCLAVAYPVINLFLLFGCIVLYRYYQAGKNGVD